jgi:transposase
MISQLLTTITGVGGIAANTFATTIDPTPFTSGRAFAAYLGLSQRIIQVAASSAWAASRAAVRNGCASCWCSAPWRCSATQLGASPLEVPVHG